MLLGQGWVIGSGEIMFPGMLLGFSPSIPSSPHSCDQLLLCFNNIHEVQTTKRKGNKLAEYCIHVYGTTLFSIIGWVQKRWHRGL